MRCVCLAFAAIVVCAASALAADLQGRITDRTGGVLQGAVVRLLNVANGEESTTVTDSSGGYRFQNLRAGTFRVAASLTGFSETARSVVVEDDAASLTVDFTLELGTLKAEPITVAARGERDTAAVPLRADTISGDTVRQNVPASTGDALVGVPGVTPVGSGPFQVRPRLRGLDSTRVLVLVDGERLNNSRTATDRAGVEVGLVDPDSIDAIEVLGGAGSVLYGTDALSGTINIITNRPRYAPVRQFTMGFDGRYSSNERGRRGTVVLGVSDRRWAARFTGGAERFDDYRAGHDFAESTQHFFDAGTIRRIDTIDTNFGFNLHAFPDPFNAPYARTTATVPRSSSEGSSINVAASAALTPKQEVQIKYQRRHAENIGFPDFEPPYFFQTITLPFSRLDKFSSTYSVRNLAPWWSKLTGTFYYQTQDRLLRNDTPVQFPVPAPAFLPISVFRRQVLSDTRQQVWTPGIDVQANFQTRPNNVLTAGLSMFRDRSEDARQTTRTTAMIGQVVNGIRGPAAIVFPEPVSTGPPTVEYPVRVPNATFMDTGVFVQDEWDATPIVRLTGGLRVDAYRVTTDPTQGYTVAPLVTGATPAIDPSTLPDVNGDRISRTALTGEAGVVLWSSRPVNVFAHYVRSYRHPNLEELLFSGPATVGNIVPNVTAEPETGHNVDGGARVRWANVSGSVAYFVNTYDGFISTEIVANAPAGSISQAINLADVRIQGVEGQAAAPFVAHGLVWSPSGSIAYTRGSVRSGTSPLSGVSLAGAPQDNITPWKVSADLRLGDRRERWWAEYGLRSQGEVTRVSPLLSQSPFLIPQDLLSLGGFTIHRIAAGCDWRQGQQRVGVTIAIDNLTDKFYREQFQFAPARGRSFSVAFHVSGNK